MGFAQPEKMESEATVREITPSHRLDFTAGKSDRRRRENRIILCFILRKSAKLRKQNRKNLSAVPS